MKPNVITHMLTSLNGKIAGQFNSSQLFETAWQVYEEVYDTLNADAWLAGRVTMQYLTQGEIALPAQYDEFLGDFIANHQAKNFVVSADPSGKLMWQTNSVVYGSRQAGHLICLVSQKADKAYLAHLRAIGVSYLLVGEDELDLSLSLEKLNQYFGIKRLVLAGGGAINGAFAKQGLVDEIHLIVAPVIELTNMPTSFEQDDGFINRELADFALKDSQILKQNMVYLTYQKA